MARAQPAAPMLRVASVAHLEKLRKQAERKRQREEREEIEAAMKAQALSRDPAEAGIDLDNIARQAVVIDFHQSSKKVKLAMRSAENVFDMISMDEHLVNAGHRITQIWADRFGVGGQAGKPSEADDCDYSPAPTPDAGYVDKSRGDVELMSVQMDRASRLWRRIMTPAEGFGRMSVYPLLFDALCGDIVNGQRWKAAEGARKPVSQWRHIVKKLTGVREPHEQAGVIRQACAELYQVLKDIEGKK